MHLPGIHPLGESLRGAPLPSVGSGRGVPGEGAGPRPGRPRPLAWLRPLPPSPLPCAPEPPWGTGAAAVPEPPRDTGGTELPGCGAAWRYRTRRGAGARRVPGPPEPVSAPPLSAPPRPAPLPPAPPGRHRGARPGGLRVPRPATGRPGTGTVAGKGPRSSFSPPIPAAVGDVVSFRPPPALILLHTPQTSAPARTAPRPFLPRVLLSPVPPGSASQHPRTQLCPYQAPFFYLPFNVCFQSCCWRSPPTQLSPLWGVVDLPSITTMPHQQRSVPPQRHNPIHVPHPGEGGLPAHPNQVSPPLQQGPPPTICAVGRGCSAAGASRTPSCEQGRMPRELGRGAQSQPPVQTSRVSLRAVMDVLRLSQGQREQHVPGEQRGGVTSPS